MSYSKLLMTLVPGETTVGVLIEKKNGTKETFRVAQDSISSIFSGNYCSGYLPSSQDGVVYLEEKEGNKLVVIQRGAREAQDLQWNDHTGTREQMKIKTKTPNAFFVFVLGPSEGGYRIKKERIFVSTGPTRGPTTPLYNAEWLGNVYNRSPSDGARTNICWGTTTVAPMGIVSVSSLMNIANDFFTQDFTQHLRGTRAIWEEYNNTRSFRETQRMTLAEVIRRMWDGLPDTH